VSHERRKGIANGPWNQRSFGKRTVPLLLYCAASAVLTTLDKCFIPIRLKLTQQRAWDKRVRFRLFAELLRWICRRIKLFWVALPLLAQGVPIAGSQSFNQNSSIAFLPISKTLMSLHFYRPLRLASDPTLSPKKHEFAYRIRVRNFRSYPQ
jgi:hypothetical protein